jgi:hypothetical protein
MVIITFELSNWKKSAKKWCDWISEMQKFVNNIANVYKNIQQNVVWLSESERLLSSIQIYPRSLVDVFRVCSKADVLLCLRSALKKPLMLKVIFQFGNKQKKRQLMP